MRGHSHWVLVTLPFARIIKNISKPYTYHIKPLPQYTLSGLIGRGLSSNSVHPSLV